MKKFYYYSLLRPVSIGTYPKQGMTSFENFDKRKTFPDGTRAWGLLEYNRRLTEKEMHDFDLKEKTEFRLHEII